MERNEYYIRNRDGKGKGNNWCIAVLIGGDDWPSRNKNHKGCTHDLFITARPMTEAEKEEMEKEYRLMFWRYYDWKTFLDDEKKYIPEDHPLFQKIEKVRKRYPLIPELPEEKDRQITMDFESNDSTFL